CQAALPHNRHRLTPLFVTACARPCARYDGYGPSRRMGRDCFPLNFKAGPLLALRLSLPLERPPYDPAASIGDVRMSFTTCSQSTSGLHSPALAKAMILLAMACLTSSAQSPVRSAKQAISSATPMTRVVSGSNFSP